MEMNIVTGAVVYIMLWWLIFLMALPFGSAPPEKIETGHATSAPAKTNLKLKFWITTLLAALALWGFNWLVTTDTFYLL